MAYSFAHASASKVLFWSAFLSTGAAVYLHANADAFALRWPLLVGGGSGSGSGVAVPSALGVAVRLVLSQLVFRRTSECFVGLGLLFALRHVERLLGSRQFCSFVLASTALSATAQLVLLAVWGDSALALASGPLAPVFGLLVFYYAHVPPVPVNPTMWPSVLTQKLSVYSLAAALSLGGGRATLIPAVTGFLAGTVVKAHLSDLLVPASVASWFKANVDPMVRSSPPGFVGPNGGGGGAGAGGGGGGGARGMGGRGGGFGGPMVGPDGRPLPENADILLPNMFGAPPPIAAANLRPEVRINEDDVATLVGLGFSRQDALRALRQNNGDVNAAANALFNQAAAEASS